MSSFPVPGGFWDLASSPHVTNQILKLVPLGQETVPELLNVIRWDPAITARILAAANGTEFGQSWPVVSLERARLLLDDATFRLLALQFRLDSLAPGRLAIQPLYNSYWTRASYRAITTQWVYNSDEEKAEVNSFLASLLCDLGRLALIHSHSQEAQQIYEAVIETAVPFEEAERTSLSPDLQEFQHRLLFQANFPAAFLQVVKSKQALDHQVNRKISTLRQVFKVSEAMADFLCFRNENPKHADKWHSRIETTYNQLWGEERTPEISLDELIVHVETAYETRFSPQSNPPPATEMLHQANRELGRLGWEASLGFVQAENRAQHAEKALRQSEDMILQLKQQALRDSLTGIYNRRFLLEALQKEILRCSRQALPIGLLFIDIDFFKSLNDTKGHLVGDLVLRRVTETLEKVIRGADVLARYGGEEFVILPNDPSEKGIVQLAERIRLAVEQLVIPVEQDQISVTVSVGCTLTMANQNDWDLIPQLLAAADAAMYDAKQLGRNRVVFRSMLNDTERELIKQTIDCSFSRWLVRQQVLESDVIDGVLMEYAPERLSLGDLALAMGFLTAKQVSEIFEDQVIAGERFGSVAQERGWLTPEELALLLARQRENPVQLARLLISKNLLPESKALELVREFNKASQAKIARTDESASEE